MDISPALSVGEIFLDEVAAVRRGVNENVLVALLNAALDYRLQVLIFRLEIFKGKIVKVSPAYYISSDAWDQAVAVARSFEGSFTLAEYRDRLGTSRKYASELLPAMDKAGITIFDKESRKVIK